MGFMEHLWPATKFSGPRLVFACRHGEEEGVRLTALGKLQAIHLAKRIRGDAWGVGEVMIFTCPVECARETAEFIARELIGYPRPLSIQDLASDDWFEGRTLAGKLFALTPRSYGAIIVVAHHAVSCVIDGVLTNDGRAGIGFTAVPPGGGICLDRKSGATHDLS